MTVVAVSMVRDEADIIEATVRHMAAQVDHVLVADNLSNDGTCDLLWDLARELPLTVINDPEPAYLQAEKMTGLAHRARTSLGAEWVVPFDADEIWYSPFGRIADVLRDVDEAMGVCSAELYDHVATGLDPLDGSPVERMGWRRVEPLPMPKVAVRWRDGLRIHQGNHGADYQGIRPVVLPGLLVVRHFPYRSVRQLVRKVRNGAAAYAAAGDRLPESMGAHWRQWGQALEAHGEGWIEDLFRTWYWRMDPRTALNVDGVDMPPLIYDPAPGSGQA